MKRIISLALAIAMALTLVSCGENSSDSADSSPDSTAQSEPDISEIESEVSTPVENDYSKQTYKITDVLGYLKIDGRYAVTKTAVDAGYEDCISFDNTAQHLAFNADCEGDVKLGITLRAGASLNRDTHYFTVTVDGAQTERVALKGLLGAETKQVLTVATGLERGEHTFDIYRETELLHGVENIVSVTMNGVLTDRPADRDLYIEFLGDSITAGYGDLTQGGDTDDPSGPAKSSGTATYAFLTAQKLNADMAAVARSGLTFAFDPIGDYWRNVSFARPDLGRTAFERKPDVVVINLGTNDENKCTYEKINYQTVKDEAVALLETVRADCPNAEIVWMYGMMNSELGDTIKAAVAEFGGESKGAHYLLGEQNYKGGGGHPSAEAHQRNADILSEFIKGIL